MFEERLLAIELVSRFRGRMTVADWKTFDGWVDGLSNWAETDGLCSQVLGSLLKREPDLIPRLTAWTRSGNRWRRRASAVALIPLARRGDFLDAAFGICDRLAGIRDDMVEKAIGWLLKEASRTQPQAVVEYLIENRQRLSRLTLRYACEKLPERLRTRALRGKSR